MIAACILRALFSIAQSSHAMPKKLTLLWQTTECPLKDWLREILAPVIREEVLDGRHSIVLDNCIVVDSNVHLVDPAYYPHFKGKNAFLLREPDEFFRDVTSTVYSNFCGVIRMHYSSAFLPRRILQIPVGYSNGLGAWGAIKPASQRSYAWSMLGQINKSSRPDTLEALMPVEPGYWYASDGWTPGAQTAATNARQNQSTADFRQITADSAFCPSPMGNVSQETTRPYSALEAGAIPILEGRWSMDVHRQLLGKHPLPTFSNWRTAASFVQSMWRDARALDQLQSECITWWAAHKKHVSTEIGAFIDRLWQAEPEPMSAFMRAYTHLPGWPAFELMRHHSASALRRRIVRQIRRIMQQGRIYERI